MYMCIHVASVVFILHLHVHVQYVHVYIVYTYMKNQVLFVIAKRNAEQEVEAKPVFLSKEERAALALKRRAEQVEAQARAREALAWDRFSQGNGQSDRKRRKINNQVASPSPLI